MDEPKPHTSADETAFAVDNWPMRLDAIRNQLKKAQTLLEQYRAALRLARVEIERRNQSIVALTSFAYQAGCVASPANLLKLALARALEITKAPVGAIVLIDPETEELTLGVHKGLTTELARIFTGQELGAGAAALMPHLVAGSGALLEYASTDDEDERMLLASGLVTSLASLPLQVGSRLFGALLVGLQGKRCFRPTELRFLMAISQQTAVILESLRLRNELWHTAESLLDGKVVGGELREVDQVGLGLELPPLLGLPATAPSIPEPAEEDLEQVLAAMMEAEAEVRQQNIDLQTLNTIAEMMNRTLDLEEILRCTVEQAQSVLEADAAWLYLVEDGNRLVMRAQVGLSAGYVHGMRSLKLGDGLEGRVAAENQAHFVESLSKEGYDRKIWVEREGLGAVAAVPITRPEPQRDAGQRDSQIVGVLATGKRTEEDYEWSAREISLLTSLANHVALAIDNARLYAQVQEDEAGLRAGNQVLREINDMLLEKNAILEDFIEDNLSLAVTISAQILQHLKASNFALGDAQIQEYTLTLQEKISRLSDLTEGELDIAPGLVAGSDELPEDDEGDEEEEEAKLESLEEGSQAESELMSLEEAVAAGLIPPHVLGKEKDQ